MIHVYATRSFKSESSDESHDYAIHFTVDEETGRVRFLEECKTSDEISIKPYMLLHLVNKVYKTVGIKLPHGVPTAIYYNCVRRASWVHKGKPSIRVQGGKRYLLDQDVNGSWINNPNIFEMIHLIQFIEDDCKSHMHSHVYLDEYGYHFLNTLLARPWVVFYQET